jgi:hypothetical protein
LPGLDGRKMSKSYDNTIPLFAPKDQLRKLIMGILTDSRAPGEPKTTEGSAVFQLYQAFASTEETAELARAYADGIAWGEAKQLVADRLEQEIAPLRVVYGAFMGLFAVMRTGNPSWAQLAASAAKVPLLFLLTLVVTFPSLYVFSALSNSRLRHVDTLRLLLAAIGVNLALLASLAPVTGFFTLSTDSYPFMVFLNVMFFAVSGLVGLSFLRKSVLAVFSPQPSPPRAVWPAPPTAGAPDPQADSTGDTARAGDDDDPRPSVAVDLRSPARPAAPQRDPGLRIFRIWTLIYAIVGAQMGWILRPFIGTPGQPFEWFRQRDSHFFESVLDTLHRLLF